MAKRYEFTERQLKKLIISSAQLGIEAGRAKHNSSQARSAIEKVYKICDNPFGFLADKN